MMALNKKSAFKKDEIELAELSKALAHPARIAILKAIATRNSCICGEIVDVLPLAQSTVSQHLKELKNAGLIVGTIDGAKSCYCINWKTFEKFASVFSELFIEIKKNENTTCC